MQIRTAHKGLGEMVATVLPAAGVGVQHLHDHGVDGILAHGAGESARREAPIHPNLRLDHAMHASA